MPRSDTGRAHRVEGSYTFADNDLTGNGLAAESLLARDRRAVYTYPDKTANLMHLVNLRGSQWLTDDLLVSANTFYRNYKRTTSNGDVEISCVDDDSGAVAFNPNGRVVALGNCQGEAAGFVDRNGDPLDGELEREAEGEFRRTKTTTQDWGATLQLSYKGKVLGFGNRVTVGMAYDGHASHSPRARPRRISFRPATAWPCSGPVPSRRMSTSRPISRTSACI